MELQRIADDLLTPLWRCLDPDYKQDQTRRGNNVWEQFQDNLACAAYTDRLTRFLEEFCSLMAVQISAEYVETLAGVLRSGEDRQVLKSLREEAATLVIFVREKNEERNALIQAKRSTTKRVLQHAASKAEDL